jgi:hypothetical protein
VNASIIKAVPPGDFEEISIHLPDWKTQFLTFVQQRKRIKYDAYTMPNISKEIQEELSKRSYCDLILERDHCQHFLVPKPT